MLRTSLEQISSQKGSSYSLVELGHRKEFKKEKNHQKQLESIKLSKKFFQRTKNSSTEVRKITGQACVTNSPIDSYKEAIKREPVKQRMANRKGEKIEQLKIIFQFVVHVSETAPDMWTQGT